MNRPVNRLVEVAQWIKSPIIHYVAKLVICWGKTSVRHPKYSAHVAYRNTINTSNTCVHKKYNTPSIILRGSGSRVVYLMHFHWLGPIKQKPIRVKEQQTSHGFKITGGNCFFKCKYGVQIKPGLCWHLESDRNLNRVFVLLFIKTNTEQSVKSLTVRLRNRDDRQDRRYFSLTL
jgi:hypothetical protein